VKNVIAVYQAKKEMEDKAKPKEEE